MYTTPLALYESLVALVTMECETEDACNVELFWNCFNEVLRKEKEDDSYIYNPRGWITGYFLGGYVPPRSKKKFPLN